RGRDGEGARRGTARAGVPDGGDVHQSRMGRTYALAGAGRHQQPSSRIRPHLVRPCRGPDRRLCRRALAQMEDAMRYVSTRGGAPAVGFLDAVLGGLAPDGGLYVPEEWPSFTREEIAGFAGRPYAEVAAAVLGKFAGEE